MSTDDNTLLPEKKEKKMNTEEALDLFFAPEEQEEDFAYGIYNNKDIIHHSYLYLNFIELLTLLVYSLIFFISIILICVLVQLYISTFSLIGYGASIVFYLMKRKYAVEIVPGYLNILKMIGTTVIPFDDIKNIELCNGLVYGKVVRIEVYSYYISLLSRDADTLYDELLKQIGKEINEIENNQNDDEELKAK